MPPGRPTYAGSISNTPSASSSSNWAGPPRTCVTRPPPSAGPGCWRRAHPARLTRGLTEDLRRPWERPAPPGTPNHHPATPPPRHLLRRRQDHQTRPKPRTTPPNGNHHGLNVKVSPSTCSTNVARGHCEFSQYRRRTDRSTTIGRPPTASSATCRTYRLCSQSETRPQPGHPTATPSRVRAVTWTVSPTTASLSTCTPANCGRRTSNSMSHTTQPAPEPTQQHVPQKTRSPTTKIV